MAGFKSSYLVRGVPGHPLHPPLTDVTVGAYTFATIAAVLSKLGIAEHGFAHAWWLALVVGIVSSAATIVAGFADWLVISAGTPLKRAATTHALTNAGASVLLVLAALFGHAGYADEAVPTGPFVLTLVGFVLLTAGGTMGGGITYVHGMRVLNLPDEPARRAMSPLPDEEKVKAAEG